MIKIMHIIARKVKYGIYNEMRKYYILILSFTYFAIIISNSPFD